MLRQVPMGGRVGPKSRQRRPILASDEASYITGAELMSMADTWRPTTGLVIPLVRHSRLGDLYLLEGRHDLGWQTIRAVQAHLLWHPPTTSSPRPDRGPDSPFEGLQMLDDLLWRSAQHAAIAMASSIRGSLAVAAAWIAHRFDLLVGERAHSAAARRTSSYSLRNIRGSRIPCSRFLAR